MAFIRKRRNRSDDCATALVIKKQKTDDASENDLVYKHAGFITKKVQF